MGLMGLLDSVAVSVGSAPPTITTQPVSNTNLNIGDNVDLSIVAAAGGGQAISKYELFKEGALMRSAATTAVTQTFSFDGINESKEGVYTIRVTQGNGSYIDSSKAVLAVLRLGLNGQRLPIETPDDNELALVPLADRTKWVKVLGSTWVMTEYWRKNATLYTQPGFLDMLIILYYNFPFGLYNVYYRWVKEEDFLAASSGKIRILQEDGSYLEIPNLNLGNENQGLYKEGTIGGEVRYGLTGFPDEWPPVEEPLIFGLDRNQNPIYLTWQEAYDQHGVKHPDLDLPDP